MTTQGLRRATLAVLLTAGISGTGMSHAAPAPAAEPVYQLSSHILDISTGRPAPQVRVSLSKLEGQRWQEVASRTTDDNGRIKDFLPKGERSNDGTYKLTFLTQPYFDRQAQASFFPYIEVNFTIKGDSHFHVPITLSPYGYSTYRGS